MREKLNENPIAQVVLIAVLVVAGAFLFISNSGGEEEEGGVETGVTEATVSVTSTTATGEVAAGGVPAAPPTSVPAPPPPRPLTAAYDSGKTVALLIVDEGGIDDRFTRSSADLLAAMPNVASFVISARQIARYASITVGLDVNRVPALVVMRPRRLSQGTPQASVDYGFQTPQGVAQAVTDASYDGPEASYHPD